MIGRTQYFRQTTSRRSFIKAGVAFGGGLVIGWVPEGYAAGDAGDPSQPFSPNAFVRIDTSGKVTVVSPAVEMGQGTYTALPMLVAEELDVDLSDVAVTHSPASDKLFANPIFGEQITGGSTAVRGFFKPMREAGAAARKMIVAAAAERLGVEAAELSTDRGAVIHPGTGKRIAYGELVIEAAKRPVPGNVALKNPSQFRIIGTTAKRLDTAGKVNGTTVFGIDVNVPGMKIATVAASPVFGGKLTSVDEAAALAVPGVHKVAKLDNGVAVIGDHYWAAKMGLNAAAPQFDDGKHAALSTADIVASLADAATRDGAVAQTTGDAAAKLRDTANKLERVYENPFLAHATMEPINCTVHSKPEACEIWVGTQIPKRAQDAVAKMLSLSAEQVRIHNHYIGGGFGRRLELDFIVQAVLVARQVDYPVKVVWSREEDIQHDMYRPYYYDRIAGAVDSTGKLVAWQHRVVGPALMARWFPPLYKDGVDLDAVDGAIDLLYDIPNFHVDYVREEAPIPMSFWRGVGAVRNGYVVECFVDELAAAANQDPVAFRRRLLGKSPRALHVMERAAELSGWGSPLEPRKGRGISLMKAMGSYISQVAEVAVDGDGQVRVDRIVCVIDTGVVVNPDTVVAQMQSGIIFGLSAVLWGNITIKDGRVQQSNFDDYRVMRINETPEIDVEIIKNNEEPGGVGEPGTCAVAPAVINAIYAATGIRLRKLPIASELFKSEPRIGRNS
ncbi:xanthine dehydrogenase family protein molybdopterin-binding subunit [Hyphomicrobium sp.]|uniref:xanthine dehydrogenase family protein molybdopterin-binding subunit n=1 Tax=Hyphomicrobium sp. TaxID=82 RepID=UPI002FE350D6